MPSPIHAFSAFNKGASLVASDSLVCAERRSQSNAKILDGNLQPAKDPASSVVVNHVHNKPERPLHLSVKVPCQLCEGRGHYVDIVDRGDRRIVIRKRCEACKGTGSIDISKGPVTDDLSPHDAFIASLIASNKRTAHCENCGGDGGWPSENGHRWDVCSICGGTGEYEVERTPINLDDLDTINRDKPLENFDADA